MEYNRIIAVTGLPGLFELVASKTDGAIVRSLDDQSAKFVSSRKHNFSHLESIEIYTKRDNVNLVEIFKAMKANSAALPDVKDSAALKGYFETVFPDMDFERVYASDMKKMVKWFEIIDKNNIELKLSDVEPAVEEPVEEASPVAEEPAPAKKATKSAKAKAAAAETESADAEAAEEKPKAKKKAAPKKAADAPVAEEEEKPKKTTRKKKTEE